MIEFLVIYLKIYKTLMNLIRIISLVRCFFEYFYDLEDMCHDKFTRRQHLCDSLETL